MKKLGVFGALVLTMALLGVASAAPAGQVIEFRMSDGHFSVPGGPDFPAVAKFDGRIVFGDPTTLSHLSGVLGIGSSPFGKVDRHLNIKAPGPVTGGPFGDGKSFEACVAGETEPGAFTEVGFEESTLVSLSAGSLKGTGRLAWGEGEFCEKQEVDGLFVPVVWGGPFSDLEAELVGPKIAGHLHLHGEGPFIGP